ncbi:uncharacterized protein BT62DRAFT_924839 [Guyanagaster necrorhizus]|uniref:Uncharacterized protein n=1 Tax=Guyanagaster necrorhizus TaxID=856835 RepID=A0A9P8ALV3_9AGAR|nr:uncharacterized protein BT62DRAFT_924839 [Guyanagaster necrorhizus MCA 3950]KAG7439222.1 hypothetical protein BT62DRAFT_924839 [Guyanagaster necrorhizus MCA 3950]
MLFLEGCTVAGELLLWLSTWSSFGAQITWDSDHGRLCSEMGSNLKVISIATMCLYCLQALTIDSEVSVEVLVKKLVSNSASEKTSESVVRDMGVERYLKPIVVEDGLVIQVGGVNTGSVFGRGILEGFRADSMSEEIENAVPVSPSVNLAEGNRAVGSHP